MEPEKPLKEGYMLFPPHGVLSQLKKSWHKKYCQLFKSSKHGIERLEVFDSEEDATKNLSARIITLENCVKITPDAPKLKITPDAQKQQNMFVIVTKTAVHHLATATENEMMEWITTLQSVAFRDDYSTHTIEEDNDLYCSSGEGVFCVTLVPSETSSRCGLEPGPYTLVVTSAAIQLRHAIHDQLLYTWPYRYIRRYGYREGKFTFEAGRKCDSGEGMFHFEHSNQQEIFRCISSKMKHMRKILRGETPPSPAIICGDNQFQAALSMEARSRSPLPPSPTSATPFTDHDFSTVSQSSTKPLITPLSEIKSFISVPPPVLKPKPTPMKPPRKHGFSSIPSKLNQENIDMSVDQSVSSLGIGNFRRLSNNDVSTTSSVSVSSDSGAYDKVEVRTDAWKTMGVDDMAHVEHLSPEINLQDEVNNSLASRIASMKSLSDDSKMVQGSKILLTQLSKSDGIEDYDTLQHFGSTSKLGNYPGYQHIPAPVSNATSPNTHSPTATVPEVPPRKDQVPAQFECKNGNIQAFRSADDSHQGYGMIRKKSTTNLQVDLGPSHTVYNQQEYAVVTKPKRV